MKQIDSIKETGAQRLNIEQLRRWEALQFGIFIHYGMSTYVGSELPSGQHPSSLYAPDRLDVDQWVAVARDAGMRYAVLTTKHVAGHCLWPSRHTDYHVGTSGNKNDVVESFVQSCERRGVLPGFYYCSWDNHHTFGSQTPSLTAELISDYVPDCQLWTEAVERAFVTRQYMDFQTAQIEELLTQYGKVAEFWIDIPAVLPRFYRQELYDLIAGHQPEAVIMMNSGSSDLNNFPIAKAWPSDLVSAERILPYSNSRNKKWREIEGELYYMPIEVCDTVGSTWFFTEDDQPRSDGELLGMYLASVCRGAGLLLDVGPDKSGLIPDKYIGALRRLRSNIDRFVT